MSWRDLLQKETKERITVPWIGGRSLQTWDRSWTIKRRPNEFGWHTFQIGARDADWVESTVTDNSVLKNVRLGYLVGDRFVPDTVSAIAPTIDELAKQFQKVWLIEAAVDKFQRISVGQYCEDSPLIYCQMEMPAGPESDILDAFLNQKPSINDIPNVVPALDAAFRFETWNRDEAEKIRKAEQERLEKEARRKELIEKLGDGVTRREMAAEDFAEAARAALALSGAVFLDHRKSPNRNEMVIRFRFMNRRFECTCHSKTLRIIDSGICLTEHGNGDFDYGVKGDTWLTLESFPSVLKEAMDDDKLVVYRHA